MELLQASSKWFGLNVFQRKRLLQHILSVKSLSVSHLTELMNFVHVIRIIRSKILFSSKITQYVPSTLTVMQKLFKKIITFYPSL